MSKEIYKDPLPAAVVLRRPPRGPTMRGCPHWGRGVGASPGFLPGTGRAFSIDDEFQAHPMSCESLLEPSPE